MTVRREKDRMWSGELGWVWSEAGKGLHQMEERSRVGKKVLMER